MLVPLVDNINGTEQTAKQVEFNKNLLAINGALYYRPAFREIAKFDNGGDYYANTEYGGKPGGTLFKSQYNQEHQLIAHFNDRLYLIDTQGVLAPVQIVGTEGRFISPPTSFTDTLDGKVLVTGGFSAVYIVDIGAGNAVVGGDADLDPSLKMIRTAGRYVSLSANTALLQFSEANDVTQFDSLAFFDAESNVDDTQNIEEIRGDLFAFGSHSIQRFRAVGTNSQPFIPVPNSVISVGFESGLIKTKDSVYFIGRDTNNARRIYAYAGGDAQVISTPAVNALINRESQGRLDPGVNGERFTWKGVDVCIFKFETFCLSLVLGQTLSWGFIEADHEPTTAEFSNLEKKTVVPYESFVTFNDGTVYCGNKYGVYKLESLANDLVATPRGNGQTGTATEEVEIDAYMQSFVRDIEEKVIVPERIEVALENQSVTPEPFPVHNSSDVAVSAVTDQAMFIQTSQDGITWGSKYYQPVSVSNRVIFNPLGGLGRYEGYMGIRIGSRDVPRLYFDKVIVE